MALNASWTWSQKGMGQASPAVALWVPWSTQLKEAHGAAVGPLCHSDLEKKKS